MDGTLSSATACSDLSARRAHSLQSSHVAVLCEKVGSEPGWESSTPLITRRDYMPPGRLT